MESKEFIKNKSGASGFFNLGLNIVLLVLTIVLTSNMVKNDVTEGYVMLFVSVMSLLWILHLIGFTIVQPNKSAVLTFFGVYSGTIKKNGFFWVNPFYGKKKLSLRARNLDVEPIKVNDKNGNPVMIGLVLVWKIADTYKACFEIESEVLQVVAKGQSNTTEIGLKGYEEFVRVQSDAALRKIAGLYAYDQSRQDERLTLRSGVEEINDKLEKNLANASPCRYPRGGSPHQLPGLRFGNCQRHVEAPAGRCHYCRS
jgi:hypothetical protein